MNKGIEILLDRMKSNPEEFTSLVDYENKWASLVREYEGILDADDMKAFYEARKALLQERFTQQVMKELLDPKEESNPYLVKPSITLSGGTTPAVWANTTSTGQVTLPNGSITLGKTTLQEQQLQQLLEMKLEVDKQKHQTIVGKLYNYLGVNK